MKKVLLFFVIAVITTLVVYIALTVIEKHRERKRTDRYIVLYSMYYLNEKNIRRTWESMIKHYKEKSLENQAIKRSLYYLDHSIMKDYATAFQMIEETFRGEAVHALHEQSLKNVKKVLALPVKN